MIKSFRGLLADGGMDTINISTNKGLIGYKIKKFELMPYAFGASDGELESTVKLYSVAPDTVDGVVNFDDSTILAVSLINAEAVADSYPSIMTTVFDHVTINQDVFVTHKNLHADAGPVNYYLEMEQFSLDLNEATVATLQDIRNS